LQEFRSWQQDTSELLIPRPKKPRHCSLSPQELRHLPAFSRHADEGTLALRELFVGLLAAGGKAREDAGSWSLSTHPLRSVTRFPSPNGAKRQSLTLREFFTGLLAARERP